MKVKKAFILMAIFSQIMMLFGCDVYTYQEDKINIVATTTMIGDLAHQIGGEKVAVTTLMGIGVDPHLYAPKAKDTSAIIQSDFIVYSGLHLEGKMVDILDGLKSKKHVLEIGEMVAENGFLVLDPDTETIDPHFWFDVRNWMIAAHALSEKLQAIDPEHTLYYQQRFEVYNEALLALHNWIHTELDNQLPLEKRILVTAHDAFGYFGEAYQFEVAAIQGISTVTEASIKDINDLIDLIIEKGVRAIFVESSVPTHTIEQVLHGTQAKGHQVTIGKPLFSDSLGDGMYSEYIEAMRYNVLAIIEGLVGEDA